MKQKTDVLPGKSDRFGKQRIGALGEEIAARYLEGKGFSVVCRNYRKRFGEIDIVVKKKSVIRFIEVKTVSVSNVKDTSFGRNDHFRPEDNVHPAKLKRLSRAIQAYLVEYRMGDEAEWQFDVVTVVLDEEGKSARVKWLEDIIL
ncbi:MAG: YraN family protein [Candidatus Taylorbacteria bacterium]|nr:YraN family protein [Candidatus Taylorbacteria bacterium]